MSNGTLLIVMPVMSDLRHLYMHAYSGHIVNSS